MKTKDEIQRAHDILISILLREVPSICAKEEIIKIEAAADVLCWVLGHAHNTGFAAILKEIDKRLTDLGFTLDRIQ